MIEAESLVDAPTMVEVTDPIARTSRPARLSEVVRSALRVRRTVIGLVLLVPTVLVAAFGSHLAPHDPRAYVDIPFSAPSGAHWLGTDVTGRDVLSRLLHGGGNTLLVAFVSSVLGVLGGAILGLAAALAKSWGDTVIMRTLDLTMAFPQYVLVLLVVAMIGSSTPLTIVLVAFIWAPPVAKVMRAAGLGVVQQDFVRYSRSLGSSRLRILFSDVLGNVTATLGVELGLRLTYSVALVAGLSFLGFGPAPGSPDWGVMIAENQAGLRLQPWATLGAVVCIALLAVGANLVTEGLARAAAQGGGGE